MNQGSGSVRASYNINVVARHRESLPSLDAYHFANILKIRARVALRVRDLVPCLVPARLNRSRWSKLRILRSVTVSVTPHSNRTGPKDTLDKGKGGKGGAGKGLGALLGANKREAQPEPEAEVEDIEKRHRE